MGDITRVIEGLDEISGYDCQQMSLFDNDVFIRGMAQEAAELLKSQQAEIDRLKAEQKKKGEWKTVHYLTYRQDFQRCTCCDYICQGWDGETGVSYDYCPNCGAEMENGDTNRKCIENPILTMLKTRYKEDGEQDG